MSSLTIIIPSFNRSALIAKTLDSLTKQTNTDFTIILVDHGSTDDTREVVSAYQSALPLEYLWLERQGFTPGIARDFGVRRAQSPLIAFLDSGMVVPSFYVEAHSDFHRNRPHHLGIGWSHGFYADQEHEIWSSPLFASIDEVGKRFNQDPTLWDKRKRQAIKLQGRQLPWLFAWSGNESMHRSDYFASGGFDDGHSGWGFSDLYLGYRLYEQGCQLAFVEDGWAIHLPHRTANSKGSTTAANGRLSYWKHRTLSLEAALYSGLDFPYFSYAEQAFHYLTQLGQRYPTLHSLPPSIAEGHERPSLLMGGTVQEAPCCDHVAIAHGGTGVPTSTSIWSCSGILLPLPDHTLNTVVVKEAWKWLGPAFNVQGNSLLASLLSEVKRVAKQTVFVDTHQATPIDGHPLVSPEILHSLCQQYELSYQLVSL